ncbi:hypothetical protein BGZ68_001052 [Mortierella alpina]|nr:hypothetical protein BGZ68_001052 [Mortierella alpina]
MTTSSRTRSLWKAHSPVPASSPQFILARSSVVFRQLRFNSSAAATESIATSGTDANASPSLKIQNPQFDEAGKELTVDITDKAVKQLKHIAVRDQNPLQALRITVDSGGCHGYQYLMDLTDEVNEDDVVFDKDGARVVIDTITLPMVSGSRIDYIEELIGSAFKVLANPHAAHSPIPPTATNHDPADHSSSTRSMSRALGITRLAVPPSLSPYMPVASRYVLACPCLYRRSFPAAHVSRTSSRSIATSSTTFKRATAVGPSRKATRSTSHGSEPSHSPGAGTKRALERRSGKGTKSAGSTSVPLAKQAQELLSDSTPSSRRSARPAYITAPSVSAKEMVQAIESSRQGTATKAAKGTEFVSPLSSSGLPSDADPFGKAADPFANQLEVAIEASLRRPKASAGSAWKDSRHSRSNAQSSEGQQLPDIQAQYLVGQARWESVKAKDVKIKNVTPENRPKVAVLEHGLDRVLFNPGVHWLQDPRSSVYNFDPYLRSICQPENFDYNALPAYKTSSLDHSLLKVATDNHGKYIGSTSSMTSILSQFYYLISGWKPLKTNHLSEAFSAQPKGFTRLSRSPTTIQLVYKGKGVYAIDSDKTFDSSTVLMQLGKSMEKMLTSTPEEFARFRKENSWKVTKTEREQPEAFNYISVDNFLLRSQLDCEDPRLPGKTFDLKTRAAVAIRLDVHNYELNQGYQLSKTHGYLESFEREYYDMMRSAFLKYSLQVRIGQMDGIFVAFHNTARIFGFQYISLDEMDSRLFGTSVMGDECFRNQLRLLNRTLDEITKKYPKQDLKITVDTDETVQSMNVWVETMPLGAASSPRGSTVKIVFDENGAPEMQPGAELSLWQIVCYSNLNKVPVVGPFDLNERATDDWELRYKIAELKKPHMMNEYRRMKAIQAEIMTDNAEKEAEVAAAAAGQSQGTTSTPKTSAEIKAARAISKRDAMRNTLRRISEQGRIKEEDEERRQADKEFLIWEPKGYTKISDLSAAPETVSAATDLPSTRSEPTPQQPESVSAKMVRRLKEAASNLTQPPTVPEAAAWNVPAPWSGETAKTSEVVHSRNMPLAVYYRRASDGKVIKLAMDDLSLVRRSISSPLVDKTEIRRLQSLQKVHGELISSLTPFDDVRFKLLEIPVRYSNYAFLQRPELERVAKLMEQPQEIMAPETTDDELREKLFNETPRYRNKLHLEYFHKWISKVATLSEDATPLKNMDDFLKIKDGQQLMRVANGLNITDRMIKNVTFAQGLDKEDGVKKTILSQIFYSEQVFTDDELKAMGYYPRIFDPAQVTSTRDILKGVGTKYRDNRVQKPRNEDAREDPTKPITSA